MPDRYRPGPGLSSPDRVAQQLFDGLLDRCDCGGLVMWGTKPHG